jgi:DNA repair protein RecN (Recombination protein N)
MSGTLSLLRIKNLALVEDLEWQLEPGFTVITGETGAGKSIIIGALQLLLGERTDKSLIRTGTDICTIEAIFSGTKLQKLDSLLAESGIDPSMDELIVKRSFSSGGTNRQFINGSPTTLAVLKTIGDELIDLHGPHDHQSILSAERQLALVDGFARAEEVVRRFEQQYRTVQSLQNEYHRLNTAESARADEINLLRHQATEIANAKLSVSEEEEILARYKLAANSKRLIELAGTITRRLSDTEDAILPQLAETQRLLRELEKVDPSQGALTEAHAASVVELSEISRSLNEYVERLDLDPTQLATLEERISVFETLKRKYGGSIPEVAAFGEKVAERLRKIEGRSEELDRLRQAIEASQAELQRNGRELHKLRSKAAPKISESIRDNLRDLGFKQSEFEAKLTSLDEPRATGFDSIELLFSPNPGEPPKPLRAIASSGEISRVMLAIKSSLAEQDAIPLLVFDEIDANVGGEIANAVGAKMKKLAGQHQILCITHLPQVAAVATHHFVVTKEVIKGRTHSHLEHVTGKARNEEIARMLGGKSDSALQHATTLLAAGKGK